MRGFYVQAEISTQFGSWLGCLQNLQAVNETDDHKMEPESSTSRINFAKFER